MPNLNRQRLYSFCVILACTFVSVLAIYFAQSYSLQYDVTSNRKNTLQPETLDALKKLAGPINVVAYATVQDTKMGDVRKFIREFILPYQRAKTDLTLSFIDPREQPKLVAQANIRTNGEMVITYGERSEHLTELNEQTLANILLRLARTQKRLILYLDGHGERKLNGIANHDLGDLGGQLVAIGFLVNSVNLTIAQEVPRNASFLVITNPQIDLLPAEIEKILAYVDSGGNLLWLLDQEPLHGLQPLVERLDLQLTPGIVVDPTSSRYNAAPTMAIASAYDIHHPITQSFNLNSIFPFARQLAVNETRDWKITPLIEVAQQGWLETGELNRPIRFDNKIDTPGPITIALALERNTPEKAQRIVVVGSGNFISNTYLGLLGNRDLGINIANWLAEDETLISIRPRLKLDSELNLSKTKLLWIVVGFLIVVPLLLLAYAWRIWWVRRRD